jgi:hypothetical protein
MVPFVIGERIKRALFEEALAQGSKGATLSNAVLQKECIDFSLRREEAGKLTHITMNMFKQSKIAVSTYVSISGNVTPGRKAISYRYKLFTVNVISGTPQVEPCTHPQLISTNHLG